MWVFLKTTFLSSTLLARRLHAFFATFVGGMLCAAVVLYLQSISHGLKTWEGFSPMNSFFCCPNEFVLHIFFFAKNAEVLMQASAACCHLANILIYRFFVAEQVQYYERLSPLVPLKSPLGSFSNIKAGDCLVTFSRRNIYSLKVGIVELAIATLLISYSYIVFVWCFPCIRE